MEDITAEYAVSDLLTPIELRMIPQVSIGCKTDLGRVRENNEDKFEYYIASDERTQATRGDIFLVCDGMGGHAAGQIASELSAKTFIDTYLNHTSEDPKAAAMAAVHVAHRFVLNVGQAIPARRGMGTTMDVLMLIQDRALVAHIGDSRIYRLRHGVLTQITTDHSWVEQVVSLGIMSREDAENHQNRNILSRCIGYDEDFNPEVFFTDVEVGDTFLLCSDGVTKHVPDSDIEAIMNDATGPSDIAWKLVNAALVGGGSDNATALVVRVDGYQVNS